MFHFFLHASSIRSQCSSFVKVSGMPKSGSRAATGRGGKCQGTRFRSSQITCRGSSSRGQLHSNQLQCTGLSEPVNLATVRTAFTFSLLPALSLPSALFVSFCLSLPLLTACQVMAERVASPVVFCHNDLLSGNFLHDETTGDVGMRGRSPCAKWELVKHTHR